VNLRASERETESILEGSWYSDVLTGPGTVRRMLWPALICFGMHRMSSSPPTHFSDSGIKLCAKCHSAAPQMFGSGLTIQCLNNPVQSYLLDSCEPQFKALNHTWRSLDWPTKESAVYRSPVTWALSLCGACGNEQVRTAHMLHTNTCTILRPLTRRFARPPRQDSEVQRTSSGSAISAQGRSLVATTAA
jgi:hypothetical protein